MKNKKTINEVSEAKDFLRKNKKIGLNQKIKIGNHTYSIASVKKEKDKIRFIHYNKWLPLGEGGRSSYKLINLYFDLDLKKWQFTDTGPWKGDLMEAVNAYFVNESLRITNLKLKKIKEAEDEENLTRKSLDLMSPWAKTQT